MELKNFLSHRHCTSLMDLWWRGGYPGSGCVIKADEPLAATLMHALLPFWPGNPYVRLARSDISHIAHKSREEREQVLFGALAHALTRAGKARREATAGMKGQAIKREAGGLIPWPSCTAPPP